MVSFKVLNSVTSVIALILFVNFLIYPELLFFIFGIDGSGSSYFIARRLSILFLGISVLTWLSRSVKNSEARQAICASIYVSMFSMSTLGLFEYFRGVAHAGILIAVLTEMTIGYLYFVKWNIGKMPNKTL